MNKKCFDCINKKPLNKETCSLCNKLNRLFAKKFKEKCTADIKQEFNGIFPGLLNI